MDGFFSIKEICYNVLPGLFKRRYIVDNDADYNYIHLFLKSLLIVVMITRLIKLTHKPLGS